MHLSFIAVFKEMDPVQVTRIYYGTDHSTEKDKYWLSVYSVTNVSHSSLHTEGQQVPTRGELTSTQFYPEDRGNRVFWNVVSHSTRSRTSNETPNEKNRFK